MSLNETGKDDVLGASQTLVQPTMVQLGGLEYNLKKQTKSWKAKKTNKKNRQQQYKKSQPASEDDVEKKRASERKANYLKGNQRQLAMQEGRVSPVQTRRTLAGGGYGQNPPGLQVNLGGSFGGGRGGGYGGGGHQQYGIPPPSFQIQGPQNVNLGFGQNVNLGLGQNFNLGLGQDINIRGPQNINLPGLNIPFMDLRICPDIILSLIVLAGAAAALGLYFAIIGVGKRKRKKKRSTNLQGPIGRADWLTALTL